MDDADATRSLAPEKAPQQPPPPPPPPGTLPGLPTPGAQRSAGRYLIREHLGRGGMASVYRAHDPRIGRDVAIKFLHASLSVDPECRLRFLREARAAGALSHRNIVVVHDVGEIEGRPCMAMELLEGETLSQLLARKGPLPVREALMIGVQLARALDYAHARGVVHRDIKPANIMRLPDGTIKVTDFGIAHIDDGLSGSTQAGAIFGTPQYMSPEQARDERLDGRSDLFSAGIVLYQLLAGQRPFDGNTVVAVAERVMHFEPEPLGVLRPEVPAALQRVVQRCLAKRPADRYASGRELALALIDVLEAQQRSDADARRARGLPLHVRWAVLLATAVALVMGFTASLVTQRLTSVLQRQAIEYGASQARFVAWQQAAAVQGEQWALVASSLQELGQARQVERIAVLDAAGRVRASTSDAGSADGGSPVAPARWTEMTTVAAPPPVGSGAADRLEGGRHAGVRVLRQTTADAGASQLRFQAPVTYRDRRVGTVVLDLSDAAHSQAARSVVVLHALLLLVTVLAAAAAAALLAWRFTRGLGVLARGLSELAHGRFAYRIASERRDELGEIYRAFDATAATLQRRESGESPRTPPPRTRNAADAPAR